MSGLTPNTTNMNLVAKPVVDTIRYIAHPEYQYWRSDWQKLRDVLAGEREIKRQGEIYLPKMKGADKDDYKLYLRRAIFYNMTGQTLNGMLGQVFRRPPAVRKIPDKFKESIRKFCKDGTGLLPFIKTTMAEQIGMGRFGVLVDIPTTPSRRAPPSYAVGYTAENIIDWTVEEVDGTFQPTRVLLREFLRDTDYIEATGNQNQQLSSAEARDLRQRAQANRTAAKNAPFGGPSPGITPAPNYSSAYLYIVMFRELILETQDDGSRIYKQYYYKQDPTHIPIAEYTPTVRGVPLAFIPFKFFGSMSNSPDVEKPPLLDICDINLAHYLSYAELEWGRMFTALPVFYAPGNDSEGAGEYHIGPNVVWEVPIGGTPGILEYTGQGLKALVDALNDKEAQIAALGGRLMPGSSKSVSESNNQTVLREANEQSLLLNIIQAVEEGMVDVIRWWLMWRDLDLDQSTNIRLEVNQDFLTAPVGAREMRAIQMIYADGIMPIEVFYEYMRKAQIIGSDIELDQFIGLMHDPNSFLNNPDAQAKQRGFNSRQQELDQATAAREQDLAERKVEVSEELAAVARANQEIANAADSTSIVGTRKLGDPEQAAPSKIDAGTLALAKTKQVADAKKPAVAPFGGGGKPAAPTPNPRAPKPRGTV